MGIPKPMLTPNAILSVLENALLACSVTGTTGTDVLKLNHCVETAPFEAVNMFSDMVDISTPDSIRQNLF